MLILFPMFISLFIVFVFRFLNAPHKPPILGVYQQKNKYYYVKFVFMYLTLRFRQLKEYLKRRLAIELGHSDDGTMRVHEQDTRLEQIHYLDQPMAVDAVYFNGASQSGAAMLCGLARRQQGVCDAFFYLKSWTKLKWDYTGSTSFQIKKESSKSVHPVESSEVEGGELLASPRLPDTYLQQRVQEEGTYKVEGIEINNIIPMRTWHIKYSGDMKLKSNPDKTVKVDASLTWSTRWQPFNYDTGLAPASMARDIAREPWSADYFRLLQKLHQTHYEQMGTIEGTATIDGVEHKLSMPCVRDHTVAKHRDWRNFHRYVYHFIYMENGDRIAVGSVSQPAVLSHLSIGYFCRSSDKKVLPIKSSNFLLYQHGERQILPKDYGFSFTAGGASYDVQVLIKDEDIFYIGKEREAKFYERWATFEINGVKGWGCAEWHYNNLGQK